MAIDTTPSTVATNALQAIPFSSLIGGPLEACIQAQALAAKTSWEFINEVGLTVDPETNEKKAITVAFEYNNNGQMTTLVVPLIIMLPIPYMSIDTVTIDFMANISAASSSVQETTEDSELGVAVDATASLQIGPFSLSVTTKANYSAKSHSKAAQDSRYSVEYTMQVHVAGGQADMPAGLQAVLNILQGSVSSVSPDELLSIYPASIPFNKTDTNAVQVTIKNNRGIVVDGTEVTLEFDSASTGEDPFEAFTVNGGVEQTEMMSLVSDPRFNNATIRSYRRRYGIAQNTRNLIASHSSGKWTSIAGQKTKLGRVSSDLALAGTNQAMAVTNSRGEVSFGLQVKEKFMTRTTPISGRLLVRADIPQLDPAGSEISPPQQETQFVTFQIIPDGRQPSVDITASPDPLTFAAAATEQKIEVTALTPTIGDPVPGLAVSVDVSFDNGPVNTVFDDIKVSGDPVGNPMPSSATAETGSDGKVTFTFTTKSSIKSTDNGAGQITISAPGAQPIVVDFTVELPAQSGDIVDVE